MGELLKCFWEILKHEILKYPLFLLGRWKLLVAAILSSLIVSRRAKQNWLLMIVICAVQVIMNIPVLFYGADIWTKLEAGGLIIWGIILAFGFYGEGKTLEKNIKDHNGNTIKINKKEFYKNTKEKALKGNCAAIYDLGICFRSGIGTKIDYDKAKRCFLTLSIRGDPSWQKIGAEELLKTTKMMEEDTKNVVERFCEGFMFFLGMEMDD